MCVFVAELLETAQFAMMWSFVIWVVLRTYIAESIARHNLIYGGWRCISRCFLELFVVLITPMPVSPADAVFGNHLHRVCDRDGCNVPHFVTRTIAAIEMRGEAYSTRVHAHCRSIRQAHNSLKIWKSWQNSCYEVDLSVVVSNCLCFVRMLCAHVRTCTSGIIIVSSYTEHMVCRTC